MNTKPHVIFEDPENLLPAPSTRPSIKCCSDILYGWCSGSCLISKPIFPSHEALYLEEEYNPVVMLPSPDPVYPVILVMPELEGLYSDEYIPTVMLPSPDPIYPNILVMPELEDTEEYIPIVMLPSSEPINPAVPNQGVGGFVFEKPSSKVVRTKKKSPIAGKQKF